MTNVLSLDFAGEVLTCAPEGRLTVGRSGDLVIDDNPYLHREFLAFEWHQDLWWARNVGARLAAYLTDERGLMRSTLAPGGQLPLVFETTLVTFSAGETLYELIITVAPTAYQPPVAMGGSTGETTITPGRFTESQLLALLALSEPVLRRSGSGSGSLASTIQSAQRLGWTSKRFDKKIENICDKLSAAGVKGLRGGASHPAPNRRLRLVEYAVSTLLVTPDDLPLLDLPRLPGPEDVDE